MKTIATYSIKGGVGKSSAAVNLATAAGAAGWRALVWDLDPQGAATELFRVRARVRGGAKGLVAKKSRLLDEARATDVVNVDLVPADFRYRHLDLVLDATKRRGGRLADLLAPLGAEYDWILLDCAPSVSLVTEGVFEAADALVVPVIPSPLSARTLDQLVDFVAKLGSQAGLKPPEIIAFLSMIDRRKKLHRELAATLRNEWPGVFVEPSIPYASVVEQMAVERRPLASFAASAPAAKAYAELWNEVAARWPEP